MAEKPTEQEFIDRYEGYVARRCARELYRAIYPGGMHTNGPLVVIVSASHLEWLLQSYKRPSDETATPLTNAEEESLRERSDLMHKPAEY